VVLSELTFWSIMKWVLVILVAGFIGQFGKTFATDLLAKVRSVRAARRRKPSKNIAVVAGPPAAPSLPDAPAQDLPPGGAPPPPAPLPDKKVLKALAKAQKKALKARQK
jgi:hypothetical protein